MTQRSDAMAAELTRCCAAFPSLTVASTSSHDSILVRLAAPEGVDELADEIYTLVAASVGPHVGVALTHVVLAGRPALEVTVVDPSLDPADLPSLMEAIVSESERLSALWHPDVPETGA